MQIIKFVNKSRCSEISHPRKNPKITILFKQNNFVLGFASKFHRNDSSAPCFYKFYNKWEELFKADETNWYDCIKVIWS